jgi:hypothetical protein
MNHELEFIQQFIVPAKRDRYFSLMRSNKGRRKLLDGLNHPKDLDMRCVCSLQPNAQTVNQIEVLLKSKGAFERCHIISSDPDLDGSEMLLHDALEQTLGKGSGTIISCISGKLAYFEGEEQNERYILEAIG